MWILEIYQSKQGEGIWTGNFSVFVRTVGCRLRCRYCDTPYARYVFDEDKNEVGADLSAEEIVGRVLLLDLHHVILTGGEPMLSEEIVELTRLLKEFDYQITIETAGVVDQPVQCDLMSISPKLKNSIPPELNEKERAEYEALAMKPEAVQQLILRYNYQLKFVIDTPEDLQEVSQYLTGFQGIVNDRILLMPQASDVETMVEKAEWIVPFCEEHGYRYCPRMQLVWYGNTRRT